MAGSLLIQVGAVVLVFAVLRRRAFSHVGMWFLLVAVAYHGLTEVFQYFVGANAAYRHFGSDQAQAFVPYVSLALFLYAIVYLAVLARRPVFSEARAEPGDTAQLLRVLDWRALGLLVVPLLLLTVQGQGWTVETGSTGTAGTGYWATGLTQQFLGLGIVLLAFVVLVRNEGRHAGWVFVAQTVAVTLLGERFLIIVASVMLLYAMRWYGFRFTRRQIIGGCAVLFGALLMISSVRAHQGRGVFHRGENVSVRASALWGGLVGLPSADTRKQVITDYLNRFDGNAFPGLLLSQQQQGIPPVGVEPMLNNVRLAVPSFLNPSKLGTSDEQRSETLYIERRFGLDPATAYLPTQFGSALGYAGLKGVFLFSLLLAGGLARLDGWALKRRSALHLIVALGVLKCCVDYERGFDTWVLMARGVLVMLLALVVWEFLRRHVFAVRHRLVISGNGTRPLRY